jgi:hypothetical protein
MSNTLLDRVVEPFAECLTADAARKIISLRADPATQARIDQLADKANEGLLTDAERAEYDRFLAAFHFITILQAKARKILRNQAAVE